MPPPLPVRRHHTHIAVGRIVQLRDGDDNLVAQLRWCATHLEPVWVYDDDSYGCPYDCIVETRTEHEIVKPPWED